MAQWKETREPYVDVHEKVKVAALNPRAGEDLIIGCALISDAGPSIPTLITSQSEFLATYSSEDLTKDYVSSLNKLYKGDTLNVLMPEGYVAPIVVAELYDAKMNPVDSCPHPEMTFYMKAVSSEDGSVVELPPMTFLSRDGDKDFGIPAPN
jgi:hypothetical protein